MIALTEIVIGLIEESPGATVDDLMPDCEGYTRKEILAAMHWMANTGRLRCERQPATGTSGGGSKPGRYYVIDKLKPVHVPETRPANSVWEWGRT